MSNKRITGVEEDRICEFITDFPTRNIGKKLTWAVIARHSGFSRQALTTNSEIRSAYENVKGKNNGPSKSKDEIITDKEAEIAKLKKQLSKQKTVVTQYEEKFVRWMSNASEFLTEEQLNRPISHSMKTEVRIRSVK
jgi:hypothetical protein|tara:strand:+ start:1070 stop:1480 length:411 start_codon:yes stop_codon:yes gene_type:complete